MSQGRDKDVYVDMPHECLVCKSSYLSKRSDSRQSPCLPQLHVSSAFKVRQVGPHWPAADSAALSFPVPDVAQLCFLIVRPWTSVWGNLGQKGATLEHCTLNAGSHFFHTSPPCIWLINELHLGAPSSAIPHSWYALSQCMMRRSHTS
jgi:hypothetical protein